MIPAYSLFEPHSVCEKFGFKIACRVKLEWVRFFQVEHGERGNAQNSVK